MTQAIKEVDPNHLVSLGTMGSGQCGTANGDYRMVHEPVDVCEYHDYDYEGNPSDNADNPIPGDEWNGLAKRLDQCGPSGLDKPLFIGEAGSPRRSRSTAAPSSSPPRSRPRPPRASTVSCFGRRSSRPPTPLTWRAGTRPTGLGTATRPRT